MSEDMNNEAGAMVRIGDFEIPLADVQTVELPVNEDVLLEVRKVERKTYSDKNDGSEKAFYSLQLALVDFPGETVFHTFFPTAQNLRSRHANRSIAVFLDTLGLPRSTESIEGLTGMRFIGRLREDQKREEFVLAKVIGAAS
jgi:hypothetical protein